MGYPISADTLARLAMQGVEHHLGPLPPVKPGPIASAIKRVTFDVLNSEAPAISGAVVRLTHDSGIELAVAHRGNDGRWHVKAWVGRKFGASEPASWGAEVVVKW